MNVQDVLIQLGYTLMDQGDSYRARPIYRASKNNTSLKIDKETGRFIDFGVGIHGDFNELIRLSLNLKNVEEAKKYLSNKGVLLVKEKNLLPELKGIKTYPPEILANLFQTHDYWLEKGISLQTLKTFQGGVARTGKMKDRYVFPIYNPTGSIIGFNGRDLTSKHSIKWKLIGPKAEFLYPTFFNSSFIQESKEVVLIESIGDCLKLWDSDVKNTLVLFGTEISIPQINMLLRTDPNKIIIALNNEPNNENIGNLASKKIQKKLFKYFDFSQVEIRLPSKKDFGECSLDEIEKWKTL